MKYFQNERCLAAGQTLICWQAEGTEICLPAREEGQKLTMIGSGAVRLEGVRRLTVEEGYRSMAQGCLAAVQSLQEMTLPESLEEISGSMLSGYAGRRLNVQLKRRLSRDTADFLSRFPTADDGSIVLQPEMLKRAELEIVMDLARSVMNEPVFAEVEGEPLFLWGPETLDSSSKTFPVNQFFQETDCYDPEAGLLRTAEYTAARQMIARRKNGSLDNLAETLTDRNMRTGKTDAIEAGTTRFHQMQVILAECRLPRHDFAETVPVLFTLHLTRLFTPSLRPILYDGKEWWLYCRNLITGDKEYPYIRQDVCILDQAGLVTDRAVSEEVYGKYRFLSSL